MLREAVGAAVPSAGVGCCFARDRLERVARDRGGVPFDPSSLTEDYEIGLHIREQGGLTVFVTMLDARGGLICTQEHFPETLEESIRQKARWFVGIALAGWDRMGWHGSLRERWMRLHDRRAALAALVILAAYLAVPAHTTVILLRDFGLLPPPPPSPLVEMGLQVTLALMAWRLASRAFWSTRAYGWRQGLLAVPRAFVANVIMMAAMLRAMRHYIRQLRGGGVLWEKTRHIFPALYSPEAHAAPL